MQPENASRQPKITPPDREYPALYEISVLGKIPEPLSARLSSLQINQTSGQNGCEMTSLTGRFKNQQDLLQVTSTLHAMKLTLTSVEWLESLY